MPYIVDTYMGGHVIGTAFNREQRDAFWRPYFLSTEVSPQIISAKPEPLVVSEPRGKVVPDILETMGTWIVRERVKSVVEDLEPGIHYFLPLHAISEKTHKELGIFYAMRIQQEIDAIVVEGTDYQQGKGRKGFAINHLIDPLGTAALDPAKLGSQHLWRSPGGFAARTFCSDEFYRRIKADGAYGWAFKKCRLGTAMDFEGYGD